MRRDLMGWWTQDSDLSAMPNFWHGITVGTKATRHVGSDDYPFEVIAISPSGKTLLLRALKQTPDKDNGYDYYSNQVYIYEPDLGGEIMEVRHNGKGWRELGNPSIPITFGTARYYQDPSF